MKKIPDNQITFYQSLDGSVNIEVLYAEENIWLTQKKMAELFDTTSQNITQHLKNLYAEGELDQMATCKDFLQVQKEGKRVVERKTNLYSLEAVIALTDEQALLVNDKSIKIIGKGKKNVFN
ncbi:MAG TPA: hypothetical protein VJH75_02700 [Patescibacteria group bacterium]|nr:hypothetical protein [Patescibacteria group bacterium]